MSTFQNKIIEILIKRAKLSINLLKQKNYNIQDIAIVGGVASNNRISREFIKLCKQFNCRFVSPEKKLCGDNAAMIALACLERYKKNIKPKINFNADPRWSLSEIINL